MLLALLGPGCSGLLGGLSDDRERQTYDGLGVGQACESDLVCRTGLSCASGQCQPVGQARENARCFLSAECAEALYCDPFRGVCARAGLQSQGESCRLSADCRAGLVCLPQRLTLSCQPPGSGDIGTPCEGTGDCMAGLNCNVLPQQRDRGLQCLDGPAGLAVLYAGPTCDEPVAGATVRPLFEVDPAFPGNDFYVLPYPNDMRRLPGRRPDLREHPAPGRTILGFDIVSRFMEAIMAQQEGFGTNPDVFFRFSGPLDLSSLSAETLSFVSLDPASPEYATNRGLQWQASTGRGVYICPNWLRIRRPWEQPLRAEETYAVLLFEGILDSQGRRVEQNPTFAQLLAPAAPGDPALAEAWGHYAPLRAFLADQEIDPAIVLGATVFTTGDPLRYLAELREAATATAPTARPWTRCDVGIASPCEEGGHEGGPSRACPDPSAAYSEAHTRVSLPIFQEGTPPYLEEGGAVSLVQGRPQIVRREDVCVSITVPNAQQPPSGWPVILYAHGTGGSFRSNVQDVARTLSRFELAGQQMGFVTLGWDQVQHGTRRGESTLDPDELVYNLLNPRGAFGNFVQGAADVHALVAWLEGLTLPGSVTPNGEPGRIDPNRIYFFGHSQGGTTGPLALPFNPSIQGAVLSGAGGGLVLGLLFKKSPVDALLGLRVALLDPDANENHPVMSLIQGFFDPVDPLNVARYLSVDAIEGLTFRKPFFHTFGLQDSYTPPETSRVFALRSGARYLAPIPEGVGVPALEGASSVEEAFAQASSGLLRLGRAYTPRGYDGHFVAFRDTQAQEDIRAFLGELARRQGVETED